MKYTTEQLDAIAAKLRDMPEPAQHPQEFTKQAAITMLAKEIASLQKRGYTLGQIAEALRGEGLDIATPTLKAYMLRTKPRRAATPAKKKATQSKNKTSNAEKSATVQFQATADSDDI